MSEMESFDVGIIGGGPAGSALAAYLAREGMSCVVLEAEKFPRPHVGESLVPASTRVFKDLNFLVKMEEAGFVHKYGAVWTADDIGVDPGKAGVAGAPTRVVKIFFPQRTHRSEILQGSLEEQVDQLVQKLEGML